MAKSSAQERRAARLRGFGESGLSLAEFCRRESLALLNWRRLARKAVPVCASPDFVVVEALPPEPPAVLGVNARGDPELRLQVSAAVMDMSAAFAAVKQTLPSAVIVYDQFHISKLLNSAVNQVQRAEHKRLIPLLPRIGAIGSE